MRHCRFGVFRSGNKRKNVCKHHRRKLTTVLRCVLRGDWPTPSAGEYGGSESGGLSGKLCLRVREKTKPIKYIYYAILYLRVDHFMQTCWGSCVIYPWSICWANQNWIKPRCCGKISRRSVKSTNFSRKAAVILADTAYLFSPSRVRFDRRFRGKIFENNEFYKNRIKSKTIVLSVSP